MSFGVPFMLYGHRSLFGQYFKFDVDLPSYLLDAKLERCSSQMKLKAKCL